MARAAPPFLTSEPLPGVRLVSEPMGHVRSVSIGLWVDAGSRDEAPAEAGSSHLLEHLLFKGTDRRTAQDIAEAFDAIGGEINAYSAKEHTCYYARVLDEDLSLAADVLLDMFRNARLADEDLTSERKVVLEELHMAADVPEDRVHDVFTETMWPGHALGRPIIGTLETVGSLDRASIERFYRAHYVPGRLVVAAAGNVDHERLATLIRGGLDAGGPVERRTAPAPLPHGGGRAGYETRPAEQAHLVWGTAAPARLDPDRYAQTVMNVLYGGGMSSRLFQEVREKRGLAYSIYSGFHSYMETGVFSVYAGTGESTASDVLAIAREQAADVASGGATREEVERAKGHVRGSLVLSMDDPGGRMSRLGRSELLYGEILTMDELLHRVDAVTPQDVTRVAQRIFGAGGFVLSCVGPVEPGALDFSTEAL